MDQGRFDSLTRSLAAAKTRRGLLGSLAALGAGLIGARGADAQQVTQAYCGNVVCNGNGCACKTGCACCVYSNGNSRCRPPGECGSGTPVVCPPSTTTQAPTTTTTAAPTTTTTTTTAAPGACPAGSSVCVLGAPGQFTPTCCGAGSACTGCGASFGCFCCPTAGQCLHCAAGTFACCSSAGACTCCAGGQTCTNGACGA